MQPARSEPAWPSLPQQRYEGASPTPRRARGNPAVVPPPTTPKTATVPASGATGRAALQASTLALRAPSRPYIRPIDAESFDAGSYEPNWSHESNPNPTGTRVAGCSRLAETVCVGPRGTGRVRQVALSPSSRATSRSGSSPKGDGHDKKGAIPEKNGNGGAEARKVKEGAPAMSVGREVPTLSQQNNSGAVRGEGGEEELDRNHLPQTGASTSVSTSLLDFKDGDSAVSTIKKPVFEVPPSSVEDLERLHPMAQISGSENAICRSRPRNIGDANASMSPAQAGERASAETARWLQWNPAFRGSSLVGTTGQDRGEQPAPLDKIVEERRCSVESVCLAFNSDERDSADIGVAFSAVLPAPCANTTDGCEALEPLTAVALPSPNHVDIRVEPSARVKDNFMSPYGNTAACDRSNSSEGPRLSPVEELCFVGLSLSKTESGMSRPSAACGGHAEHPGVSAEPLTESVSSRNLHELPSMVKSAHRASEIRMAGNDHARRTGGGGVVQPLSLADLTLCADAMTPIACVPLALSSDPFARSASSDLLPVAHVDNVGSTSLVC